MKNKKSQIGATLTWMAAFAIIFFIMVLFIAGIALGSAMKRISYGSDEIILERYDKESLRSQRVLINTLNKEISFRDENIKIKNALRKLALLDEGSKKELKNIIKQEILNLNKEKNNCYFFRAEHDLEWVRKYTENNPDPRAAPYIDSAVKKQSIEIDSIPDYGTKDPRADKYISSAKKKISDRAVSLILFSEDNKINVNFYYGRCYYSKGH